MVRIYLCILGVEIVDLSINEPLYVPDMLDSMDCEVDDV